jgi:uncharacterized protein (TIGR02145 family)
MKNSLRTIFAAIIILTISCNKEDNPTIPVLTTTIITSITSTSATGGGTITSNGGETITTSGLCWSTTNPLPTVADDTTKGLAQTGSFIANLTNLTPSSQYYVRAYATNAVGTGYGEVQSFATGNAAPTARNVSITGNKNVGATLTAAYTYIDAENNPESGTTIRWYIANDTIGATVNTITGATTNTYVVVSGDKDKFIKVGITPGSSAGTTPGQEYKSYWIGPIGGETVTFTYNGQTVTYGIIVSSVTGRKWLDRNLGAPSTPTAYDDWQNYGDLFQWGRGADGHQLVNRAQTIAATTGSNITTVLSNVDSPGHSNFIITNSNSIVDWRNPSSELLWQAPDRINDPCPEGWHVPTNDEWLQENFNGSFQDAYAKLKITITFVRWWDDGTFGGGSDGSYYWTSTSWPGYPSYARSIVFNYIESDITQGDPRKGIGQAIRCVKNQ